MPEATTAERPAEKVMRQWYQGKLAERLMQAASMAQDRNLLRRGARKMQDGTLGSGGSGGSGGSTAIDAEEEPVNITIGDQIFTQTLPAPPAASPEASVPPAAAATETPLWQKLLASAAMVAGGAGAGAGVPWLLGAFDRPEVQQAAPAIDTDTQYELSIRPEAKP